MLDINDWCRVTGDGNLVSRPCPFGNYCNSECALYIRCDDAGETETEYSCGINFLVKDIHTIAQALKSIADDGLSTYEQNYR